MRIQHHAQIKLLLCCIGLFGLLLSACNASSGAVGQSTTSAVGTTIPPTATSTTPPTATATTAPQPTATKAPTATSVPSCSTVSSGTKALPTSHGAVTFDFVSGLITSGNAPQVSISVASSAVSVMGINGVHLSEVADILTCQQLQLVHYSQTTVMGVANSAVLIALKAQNGDLVFAIITPQGNGDVGAQWTTYTP